jgi:hypothetical protein
VSADDCWAVGGPLIEHYAGNVWIIVPNAVPSGGDVSSVACVSANDCWAVGASTDASGNDQTFIEQYTSGRWSIVPSPNPTSSPGSALYGVTCVNTGDCWAVGANGGLACFQACVAQTLIEQGSPSGWSIVQNATPLGSTAGEFHGVTCFSIHCWAVGWYAVGADGRGLSLAVQETGFRWSEVASPSPSTTANYELESMACVSADDCWAVGWSNAGSLSRPVVERGR